MRQRARALAQLPSLMWRATFASDERVYAKIEEFARLTVPVAKLPELDRWYFRDETLLRWYDPEGNRPSFGSYDGLYALAELAKYVVHLPGDTAECGIHAGRGAELICRATQSDHAGSRPERHFAFDSWEGLSTPAAIDGGHWVGGQYAVSLEVARAVVEPYRVTYLQRWVPDRFDEVADRRFSLVHLDTDLYEPTRDALAFFGPRMDPGGLLVVDDEGHASCPGVRAAVDEYVASEGHVAVRLPTAQAPIQVVDARTSDAS
jgi:O-methyltransferase